jgi:signal transduction histidine kinase
VETLAKEADRVASAPESADWAVANVATTAEIHRLIERLNSLVSRVHESRERERTFLEDASHDLRTPIAVARAELDLARSRTFEPQTRQALDSAIEELDRLDRLAADLLILARMRVQPDRPVEEVHLGHLVRRAAARLVRGPGRQQLSVTVEGQAEVQGDPLTLDRAIDNVLTNAFRHASASVAIDITHFQGEAFIRVCDDGPGFPEPMLESATERFTRDPGNVEGTGLGLAITAAIVEAHGGVLECANRPEGGAIVELHLPAGEQDLTPFSTSVVD